MKFILSVVFFPLILCSPHNHYLKRRLSFAENPSKYLKTSNDLLMQEALFIHTDSYIPGSENDRLNFDFPLDSVRLEGLSHATEVPTKSLLERHNLQATLDEYKFFEANDILPVIVESEVQLLPVEKTQEGQSTSSSPISQLDEFSSSTQTSEQMSFYYKSTIPLFDPRSVIFSWRYELVGSNFSQAYFKFKKPIVKFIHLTSSHFIDALMLNYAGDLCEKYGKITTESDDYSFLSIIDEIKAVFRTIPSPTLHFKPFYGVFKATTRIGCHSKMQPKKRISLYFMFTSISYLMQNEECENKETIITLLQSVFSELSKNSHFVSRKWIFLRVFLKKKYSIVTNEVTSFRQFARFDICTVLFIYNEARFNEKTNHLFYQIWKAALGERNKTGGIELSNNPQLIIASGKEKIIPTFEAAARKLYQIKFTELVFKKWKSTQELLKEYSVLKHYFNCFVDFRQRIFNGTDFESLRIALERIKVQLNDYSLADYALIRQFFVELEYFIHFKCLLFAYDFCNEAKCKSSDFNFSNVFQEFKRIERVSDEIQEILYSVGISFDRINLESINPHFQFVSLSELSDNLFAIYPGTNSLEQYNSALKFANCLNSFQYFKPELGYLPKGDSRLKCAGYREVLLTIIESNDKKDIQIFFSDIRYKELRKALKFNPQFYSETNPEEVKFYFEHFVAYLILYNQ